MKKTLRLIFNCQKAQLAGHHFWDTHVNHIIKLNLSPRRVFLKRGKPHKENEEEEEEEPYPHLARTRRPDALMNPC